MKHHNHQYLVALFASQSLKAEPSRDGYNSLMFLNEIKPITNHKTLKPIVNYLELESK